MAARESPGPKGKDPIGHWKSSHVLLEKTLENLRTRRLELRDVETRFYERVFLATDRGPTLLTLGPRGFQFQLGKWKLELRIEA